MKKANTLKVGSILKGNKEYIIDKVLGQGSFGITYLARRKEVKTEKIEGPLGAIQQDVEYFVKVAIKEFFMQDFNDREESGTVRMTSASMIGDYKRKFRSEAINLSKMNSDNIVKVIDIFECNNTTYYVMEYIDGTNLNDYINKKNGLSEKEVKEIIKTIALSVGYMHKNKMLHLDIKPNNIMMNKKGHLFLIDFGLSKHYGNDGKAETSTSIGLGTPGYAPLEQTAPPKNQKFPTYIDVYALGATMFKMLTNTVPPKASEIINYPGLIAEEMTKKNISKKMIDFVMYAMTPAFAKRPQTTEDFLKALEFNTSLPTDNSAVEATIIATAYGSTKNNSSKPQKDSANSQKKQTNNDSKNLKTNTKNNKINKSKLAAIISALIIVGGIIVIIFGVNSTDKNSADTPSVLNLNVTNQEYQDANGNKYLYTGEISADSIPNGYGTAVYLNDTVKYKYEGKWNKAKRHSDTARFEFRNGDVYEGSFRDDGFYYGRLTIKEDKSSFLGYWKDFAPLKGNWYDAKGKVFEVVR